MPTAVATHELLARSRTADFHAAFLIPHLRPAMSVIDCGCGPGSITLGLAAHLREGTITGIDTAADALDIARRAADRDRVRNARFRAASIYVLPFADGSFDAAFVNAVFVHLSRPARALAEIARVVKPGGLVAVSEPELATARIYPEEPALARMMSVWAELSGAAGGAAKTPAALGRLAEDAGLSEIEHSRAQEVWSGERKDLFARYCRDVFSRPDVQKTVLDRGLGSPGWLADLVSTALPRWREHDHGMMSHGWLRLLFRKSSEAPRMTGLAAGSVRRLPR